MKERPILFSGPMVRAILDGRKTQTRRIYRGTPTIDGERHPDGSGETWTDWGRCPYGVPGDRLWVRETWYCDDYRVQRGPFLEVDGAKEMTVYAADGPAGYEDGEPKWRPSIHMPRWASRITLEVTGVRVERLQDISEADAVAEGCMSDVDQLKGLSHLRGSDAARALPSRLLSARDAYRYLWLDINGPGSWDANPWVWVVEFRGAA